jgi:hypothetical protein
VAGIGPPPKPPSMRRRRNKVAGATTLEPQGPSGPPPPLPSRGCPSCNGTGRLSEKKGCPSCGGTGAQPWHAMVEAWWTDVWASPMAHEYVESDKHGLYLLAELHDQFWRTGEREIAGEIRLQEQRFGLSPMDRRRLQWQVATTEERLRKGTQPPAPRAAVQPPRAKDPRRALALVPGGKRA